MTVVRSKRVLPRAAEHVYNYGSGGEGGGERGVWGVRVNMAQGHDFFPFKRRFTSLR